MTWIGLLWIVAGAALLHSDPLPAFRIVLGEWFLGIVWTSLWYFAISASVVYLDCCVEPGSGDEVQLLMNPMSAIVTGMFVYWTQSLPGRSRTEKRSIVLRTLRHVSSVAFCFCITVNFLPVATPGRAVTVAGVFTILILRYILSCLRYAGRRQ